MQDESQEISLETIPIKYKSKDVTEVEMFYISSDLTPTFKDIIKLFPQYEFTLRALHKLAKDNFWEEKRKDYVASLTKQLKEKMMVSSLKNRIQVSNAGMNLFGKMYDKYSKAIDSGQIVVTGKEISMIGDMVLKASGAETGNVNIDNSKHLKITLPKPVEEMTTEELIEYSEAIEDAEIVEE